MAVSALMYCNESWVMKHKDKSILNPAEMIFFRRDDIRAEENSRKPQLGDRLMKVSYLQMRSVRPHSTSNKKTKCHSINIITDCRDFTKEIKK